MIGDRVAVDLSRIVRKIRRKRADAAKQAALAAKPLCPYSPFHPFESHPPSVTLWDMQRLRTGYSPEGRNATGSALRLEFLTELQKRAGVRFGKYRFKHKHGVADPDQAGITLTGKHIPETLRRALQWSIKRHGLPMPETSTRTRERMLGGGGN